jgi:hypothetical protein
MLTTAEEKRLEQIEELLKSTKLSPTERRDLEIERMNLGSLAYHGGSRRKTRRRKSTRRKTSKRMKRR